MRNKRAGFTLVELLVVIAIIAVLAGILFPVFAAIKRKARIAADESNLRQLGHALKTYMLDHNGNAPPTLDVVIKETRLQAHGDLKKQFFSYQEDGFGNVLYNYYGYQANGVAAPANVFFSGGANTAAGGVWPPTVGTAASWAAYGITSWNKFPMMRNRHHPDSTIVTWSPYNRASDGGADPPYDNGPVIILRADGSVKLFADSAAQGLFQPDPTTGLTFWQHQSP